MTHEHDDHDAPHRVCVEADAGVQRLTEGRFRIETDPSGVYLSDKLSGERVQILQGETKPIPCDDRLAAQVATLSERELQVLNALGEGRDMREIAEQLGVSIKSVETFRSRIRRKLKIEKRPQLIAFAVEWFLRSRRG